MGPCPEPSLVEVDILDPKTHEPLPRGEIGEIAVRGKSVMKGYLNNKEETRRVMQGGRFLTGDKGYIDENGQLFMTGRIKDIINIAGIKISPYEVEAVLNNHPAVAESVVVSVPNALYGEAVKAYVRIRKGAAATERELIRFAAEHLINFQVPKQIDFVDAFPLNNMGKLDRNKLKAPGDAP
jgi:long-chain acyl-CoA synthetase